MSAYPQHAGSKGGGAGATAANKITNSGLRNTLQRAVIGLYAGPFDWTPDEAAASLGYHPADIRPRFSELVLAGYDRKGNLIRPPLLRKTHTTRFSFRGNPQHVYEKI